jgi:hypothetical protein
MFVGIGVVGAAVLGIFVFGEPTDADLLPDAVDRLAGRSQADQRACVKALPPAGRRALRAIR